MTRTEKFRDAYGYQWAMSQKKERFIKELIETHTGKSVEFYGMGAGSTKRVSGSAAENGYEVGTPDLHIEGTPLYVEVTGPNTFTSASNSSIWVRPDKIRHAHYAFKRGETVFLAHILPKSSVRRHLDSTGADFMLCHKDNPLAERARIKLGAILGRVSGKKATDEMCKLARSLYDRGELFDLNKPKSFDDDVVAIIPFDKDFFDNCKSFKMIRYSKKGIQEEFVEIQQRLKLGNIS